MAPERPNMHARHVLWGVVTRTSNAATDAASMTRVVWSGWAEVAVAREEAVAEVGVRWRRARPESNRPEANLHPVRKGSKRTNERATVARDGRCARRKVVERPGDCAMALTAWRIVLGAV